MSYNITVEMSMFCAITAVWKSRGYIYIDVKREFSEENLVINWTWKMRVGERINRADLSSHMEKQVDVSNANYKIKEKNVYKVLILTINISGDYLLKAEFEMI
jgi:uncharacterized protein YcgL (UPF0745 family)